jgi:glutamate carboxypeptidase
VTMIEDLRALVEHESPSDDPSRVSMLAAWVSARLEAAGARSERLPCSGRGDAVRATLRAPGTSGGTLLLGHLDTVWPVGTLAERPFRLEDGRASGPGVFDMKAGVAVALAIFRKAGSGAPRPRVSLFLAPDEEVGSEASREAMLGFAREHDRVLVLEPSLAGAAKIARKGTGLAEVRFRGRAAHAGLEPENGASALLEMARFALFAASLSDSAAGTTVSPTVAVAGEKTNVIPDAARLLADVRVWSRSEESRIRTALAEYVSGDSGVAVSLEARFDRPPMEPSDASRELFEGMRAAAAAFGRELRGERVGGASDGNLTASAGIPTLDGLGPAGGGAHARDEWVEARDLEFREALLNRFLEERP